MREPLYDVVWPLGKSAYEKVSVAPRVADFDGKTICELWDWLFRGEDIFPLIRQSLLKRYANVRVVEYATFGNIRGPNEADVVAALPDLLRKQRCDAVICGIAS